MLEERALAEDLAGAEAAHVDRGAGRSTIEATTSPLTTTNSASSRLPRSITVWPGSKWTTTTPWNSSLSWSPERSRSSLLFISCRQTRLELHHRRAAPLLGVEAAEETLERAGAAVLELAGVLQPLDAAGQRVVHRVEAARLDEHGDGAVVEAVAGVLVRHPAVLVDRLGDVAQADVDVGELEVEVEVVGTELEVLLDALLRLGVALQDDQVVDVYCCSGEPSFLPKNFLITGVAPLRRDSTTRARFGIAGDAGALAR